MALPLRLFALVPLATTAPGVTPESGHRFSEKLMLDRLERSDGRAAAKQG